MKNFKPIPTEDFFVISHEHKNRFFVVIWPKKPLGHIKCRPRIDLFFSKNQNFDPKHKILKNQWEKLNRFYYCQISKNLFFKSALLLSDRFWADLNMCPRIFFGQIQKGFQLVAMYVCCWSVQVLGGSIFCPGLFFQERKLKRLGSWLAIEQPCKTEKEFCTASTVHGTSTCRELACLQNKYV